MPPLTKLKKNDLVEFAQVMILANTPLSLFSGISQTSGMEKLRQCPTAVLLTYYDWVTARGKRSEFVVSLAYAILCALVVRSRDESIPDLDPSRLEWGDAISSFAHRAAVGTSRPKITIAAPNAKITTTSSEPAANRFGGLYDAHGYQIGGS